MGQNHSIDEVFNCENSENKEWVYCNFNMWHSVTMLAKFRLNTCVDSENGKVDIYFKHFGLCVLVFSHLNL